MQFSRTINKKRKEKNRMICVLTGVRGVQTCGRLLAEGSWRAPASGAACVVVATRTGIRERRGGWPLQRT